MIANDVHVHIDAKVFNEAYRPQLDNMARIQIMFGGASSGKSRFKAQQVIIDIMAGGRNYLVCRQVARTIRRSVFNEIKRVIGDFGVNELFNINKSDAIITCVNGYQILFAGLDDIEKIKSITPEKGAITDVWVEEATETERNSIKQLLKRQRGGDEHIPKRLHMTFNPILRDVWIYKDYFEPIAWADDQTEYWGDDWTILKTWYVHNRFLTSEDVNGLLNEKDRYFRDVYTFGNWGVLGNVIFTNWVVADLNNPNDEYYLPEAQRTNRRNGLDFGYSKDPAALGVSHYDKKHKTIYFYDELYEVGLTNDLLADEIKQMIGHYKKDEAGQDVYVDTDMIIADSAEPKSIDELRRYGIRIKGAKKGKDSVVHGIQWLQQQTIVLDKNCINMRNELQSYKWKENDAGVILRRGGVPIPIDENNHLIDAFRYALEDDMIDNQVIRMDVNPIYD